jgi:hypothetical protein
MLRLLSSILLAFNLFSFWMTRPPLASMRFTNQGLEYVFNQQAIFHAELQADAKIKEAFLGYQSEGRAVQYVAIENLQSGKISVTVNLATESLRPFSTVAYWYQFTSDQGDAYTSPHYQFYYEDNRFTWQILQDDLFTIHWINGDLTFAQDVLNSAHSGIARIQELINVSAPNDSIDIYVYASAEDLQDIQNREDNTWVAGNASPDLGVVLLSIAPGLDQLLIMEQQVPHELAHILLYQLTGTGYTNLPSWLNEGIASMVELYPNSDYAYVLEVAKKDNTIIPMEELCEGFPHDAANAFLAYAQADSFSHFLKDNYGTAGIEKLIMDYKDGMGCSEGAQAALGSSINVLDYRWKQQVLNANAATLMLKNLLPYFLLAGVIIALPLFTLLFIHQKNQASS